MWDSCDRRLILAWWLVLVVSAQAATATSVCPTIIEKNEAFTVDVTIDTGVMPLGAYSVTVTYPAVDVVITSIVGGTTAEFTSAPTTNGGTFTSGSTPFNAFQNTNLSGPTSVSNVARLHFLSQNVMPTTVDITITVNGLFDTNGLPIPSVGGGCRMALALARSVTINTSCP